MPPVRPRGDSKRLGRRVKVDSDPVFITDNRPPHRRSADPRLRLDLDEGVVDES
jgi:hypothetical protein